MVADARAVLYKLRGTVESGTVLRWACVWCVGLGPAGFASKSLARDDRPAFRQGAYPIQCSLARSLDGCLGRIPGVRMKRVSRLTILAEVEAEEAASPNLEVSP